MASESNLKINTQKKVYTRNDAFTYMGFKKSWFMGFRLSNEFAGIHTYIHKPFLNTLLYSLKFKVPCTQDTISEKYKIIKIRS